MGREIEVSIVLLVSGLMLTCCIDKEGSEEGGVNVSSISLNLAPGDGSRMADGKQLGPDDIEQLSFDDGRSFEVGSNSKNGRCLDMSGFTIDDHLRICSVENASVLIAYQMNGSGNASVQIEWAINGTFSPAGILIMSDDVLSKISFDLFSNKNWSCSMIKNMVIRMTAPEWTEDHHVTVYLDSVRLKLECYRKVDGQTK